MQLLFTVEEFSLLVDILLNSERDELIQNRYRQRASPLLQRALSHDLRLDIAELEDLDVILKERYGRLEQSLPVCDSASSRQELLHEQELLDSMMDRVAEASAMV